MRNARSESAQLQPGNVISPLAVRSIICFQNGKQLRRVGDFELIEQIAVFALRFIQEGERHIRIFVRLAVGVVMRGDVYGVVFRAEHRLCGIVHIDIQTVLVLTENVIRITVLDHFEDLRRAERVFRICGQIQIREIVFDVGIVQN